MGLWYSINKPECDVKGEPLFARISLGKYTNNSTAFLMCGGPSLSMVDPDRIRGIGRTVFSLNNTYPFIKPDIWLGLDMPECYNKQIYWEPFMKITRFEYRTRTVESVPISSLFNMYFLNIQEPNGDHDPRIFTERDNYIDFLWHRSSFITALQLMVWMGFNKIYLFGCDLNNKDKLYFNDIKLNQEYKNINAYLYNRIDEYLKWFSTTSKQYGISVYSCSPDSIINEYLEYKNYKAVIASIESGIPRGGEFLHSHEGLKREKEAQALREKTQ